MVGTSPPRPPPPRRAAHGDGPGSPETSSKRRSRWPRQQQTTSSAPQRPSSWRNRPPLEHAQAQRETELPSMPNAAVADRAAAGRRRHLAICFGLAGRCAAKSPCARQPHRDRVDRGREHLARCAGRAPEGGVASAASRSVRGDSRWSRKSRRSRDQVAERLVRHLLVRPPSSCVGQRLGLRVLACEQQATHLGQRGERIRRRGVGATG